MVWTNHDGLPKHKAGSQLDSPPPYTCIVDNFNLPTTIGQISLVSALIRAKPLFWDSPRLFLPPPPQQNMMHDGGVLTSPSIFTLADDAPSLTPLSKKPTEQNLRERCRWLNWGWTRWEAAMIADKLKVSWKKEKANHEAWLLVLPPNDKKGFLAKMESLYNTRALDKDGVHFPPHLVNSAGPKQRIPPDAVGCRKMPWINMVLDSIESLYTINEEANENVEPPTIHSLALKLKDNKVIPFVKAFKHKNGQEEDEVQDHYASITKFKCPDNPNHFVQSISLPTTRWISLTIDSTSISSKYLISQTLPIHPTSKSSSTFECFGWHHLTLVGPCTVIVMPWQ